MAILVLCWTFKLTMFDAPVPQEDAFVWAGYLERLEIQMDRKFILGTMLIHRGHDFREA